MDNEFSKARSGTGTNEWAERKYNIQQGCSNNCLYCYARASALQYGRIQNGIEWTNEIINEESVNKKWRKTDDIIMFPTTHDITPANLEACLYTLRNILAPGNKVLIVSKPHLECIQTLCDMLTPFKDQILFRFTIGTLLRDLASLWEPGAPKPIERVDSLKWAYYHGFQTSISMEPMLGSVDAAIYTCHILFEYVTETIWIGKMNKIRSRVDISDPAVLKAVEEIEYLQRDEEILRMVAALNRFPKIRWKDSIKEVIRRNENRGY